MAKRLGNDHKDDPNVHLKPVLGIPPAKYLPVVYAIAGLLLLYLFLIVPGVRNNGAQIRFTSEPYGAAVYVDAMYAGTTPFTAFVPSGDRFVRIEAAGYQVLTVPENIPGRVFGSLIFPRRTSLSYTLSPGDTTQLGIRAGSEFAAWGMVDRFFATYRPEPVLTAGANAAYYLDTTQRDVYDEIVTQSMAFAHDEIMAKDIIHAKNAVSSGPAPFSAASYVDLLQNFIQVQTDYENTGFWVYQVLRSPRAETYANSSWFKDYLSRYESLLMAADAPAVGYLPPVTANGLEFVGLSGGTAVVGSPMAGTDTHPYIAVLDDYYILDREVTNEMFAQFVSEVSEWSLENVGDLVAEGLVEDTYLTSLAQGKPDSPVTHVSFYSASAFCNWLTSRLPESLADFEVRLPTSAEWEYAARLAEQAGSEQTPVFKSGDVSGPQPASARGTANTISDLMGNVWEWCSNGYSPSGATLTSWSDGNALGHDTPYEPPERIVRGGSWANTEREIELYTVGSQPSYWCTEVLGFRPVLAKKRDNG